MAERTHPGDRHSTSPAASSTCTTRVVDQEAHPEVRAGGGFRSRVPRRTSDGRRTPRRVGLRQGAGARHRLPASRSRAFPDRGTRCMRKPTAVSAWPPCDVITFGGTSASWSSTTRRNRDCTGPNGLPTRSCWTWSADLLRRRGDVRRVAGLSRQIGLASHRQRRHQRVPPGGDRRSRIWPRTFARGTAPPWLPSR